MKLITWNVNGLRACLNKSFTDYIFKSGADIIAVQETKLNEKLAEVSSLGYFTAWNFAKRLGYSGTLCLFKDEPLSIIYGFGSEEAETEGRLITLEYTSFYFVNVYVPNSQEGRERWYFRLEWDKKLLKYLTDLQSVKPVIIIGDFNVAHKYIDIYPENLRNEENPYGFLSEERDNFDAILNEGFVDVFRELYPTAQTYL